MNPRRVMVFDEAGAFAENKDAAAKIRQADLRKALEAGEPIVLDFANVEYATQSFVHALIAQAVRKNPDSLDLISFANCGDPVRGIIEIVVDYAQEDTPET